VRVSVVVVVVVFPVLFLKPLPHGPVFHKASLHSNPGFVLSQTMVCFHHSAEDHPRHLDIAVTVSEWSAIRAVGDTGTNTLNWIVSPLYIGENMYPMPPKSAAASPHFVAP
jgi:hypothetical protein